MKPDFHMWWSGFFFGIGFTFAAIWIAGTVVGW